MSERGRELAAEELPRAAAPGIVETRQSVLRARRTAQIVLGLLFSLGIIGLLYWGREALPPFLLGLVVAYMLLPPVRRLEQTLPGSGLWAKARRPLAAIVVAFLTVILIGFLLRSLAQPVIEQTSQIFSSLDALWQQAQANAPQLQAWYDLNVPAEAQVWVDQAFETIGRAALSVSGSLGRWILGFTGNALSSVVAFVAAPLFVVYFLIDEPKITHQIREQFPRPWAGDALALVHIFNRVFGSYTRGVIIESIIVGIITGLGYFLIGVEVWLPLGVIALVGEIVPIIGPWVAFIISLPVILATQPDRALLALGLFVIIQILEGWFLAPRIQGGAVHFTASATLLALAIGGAIGGAMGVILALPAAALLRDVAFYMSYRVGGLSPQAAVARLPSFARTEARGRRRAAPAAPEVAA